MRTQILITSLFGCVLAACGGDDGGGSGGPDAPPAIDAAPDAPAGGGLGQRCVPTNGGSDCPASAPLCVGSSQTTGNCTVLCVTDGTMMTNAQAQPSSITPTPSNAPCTAAFSGTVGNPLCATIIAGGDLGFMPADNPLQANKTYTNVHLTCAIQCGANNTCPAGLTPMGTLPQCTCQ